MLKFNSFVFNTEEQSLSKHISTDKVRTQIRSPYIYGIGGVIISSEK